LLADMRCAAMLMAAIWRDMARVIDAGALLLPPYVDALPLP